MYRTAKSIQSGNRVRERETLTEYTKIYQINVRYFYLFLALSTNKVIKYEKKSVKKRDGEFYKRIKEGDVWRVKARPAVVCKNRNTEWQHRSRRWVCNCIASYAS